MRKKEEKKKTRKAKGKEKYKYAKQLEKQLKAEYPDDGDRLDIISFLKIFINLEMLIRYH